MVLVHALFYICLLGFSTFCSRENYSLSFPSPSRLLPFLSIYIYEKQGDCERKAREAGEMGICYNEDKYTITAVDNIIEAIVTNKGHVAAKWVDDILLINHGHMSDLIVGFDLEWCPNTLYGTRGENPVALLQLCVGHCCLIFQLLYCDFIPDKLCDFLKDYRHRFVGVGIKEDAEKLERGYGTEVTHLVDLRHLAAEHMVRPEMRRWGLKNLAREVMGVQMDKPKSVTLSNWGKRVLSNKQIEYAAVDAFVSFEIGRMLYAGEF